MRQGRSISKKTDIADRVLLVRLEAVAPVLREALGESGRVVEARNLFQACAALDTLRPTVVLIGKAFPPFELEVVRAKSPLGTLVRVVDADAQVHTLLRLVEEASPRRRPPQL